MNGTTQQKVNQEKLQAKCKKIIITIGLGMLPGPKHVGLKCDSFNPQGMKMGLVVLLRFKHAKLESIIGEK